jgi:hypothetical protein
VPVTKICFYQVFINAPETAFTYFIERTQQILCWWLAAMSVQYAIRSCEQILLCSEVKGRSHFSFHIVNHLLKPFGCKTFTGALHRQCNWEYLQPTSSSSHLHIRQAASTSVIMSSYTGELLRGGIGELESGACNFTSKLSTAKLEVPNSESNSRSFMRLETRITKITENTEMLEAAGRERQERMWRMPQELFDSAVLADLAQSMELKGQLDQLFNDLRRFKACAQRHENINRMGRSGLELLNLRPPSVCISKNVLQQMLTTLKCRFLGVMPLLVGTGGAGRETGLRGRFTFER